MFTGLVEAIAVLEQIRQQGHSAAIRLRAPAIVEDVKLGDSIAVNGVCLTVTAFDAQSFTVDAVPETIRRTNLSRLRPGDGVNVERALRMGDRLGGHIVSGHVDGVGEIVRIAKEEIATVIEIAADAACLRYIVEKGSICVDGVSLTVMDVGKHSFRVSLIPHTGHETTLGRATVGRAVNLECDVLAKYVERLLGGSTGQPAHETVSIELLRENGFA